MLFRSLGNANFFSASNIYITSSVVQIDDNIITLNAFAPYLRYAGIEMYDSSSGTLSSILWDSQGDYFFLTGSGINGKILTGPDQQGNLTSAKIPKATGGNILGDSIISDNGSTVSVTGTISASSFTGAGTGLTGTAASLTAGAANSVAWTNVSGRPTAVSSFTNDSKYHYHRTDIASLSSSANIVQPVGTFDGNNLTNGPTNAWYNYFSSTHSDYLTSLIANLHRTADWYVAYKEGPGGTPTNPTWYKLVHSGNYTDYTVTKTGTGASGNWAITSSWATNATTDLNGGVTSVAAGTGISVNSTTGAVTVTNSSPNATHTGDVTGATALTIANNAVTTAKITDGNVTYAKIQNISATSRVLGRITAGAGVIEELTGANIATIIGSSTVTSASYALSASYAYVADSVNFASQTANRFLAAPNGSNGIPTFRAIVAADIPTLNQNTTGTAAGLSATLAIGSGGTGATTAQAAINALAGGVGAGQYLRGNATNVVMSAIQAADVPTLNQNTTGTAATASYANALNGANNYTVNSLTEGGYLAYPLREYAINLSSQSTASFIQLQLIILLELMVHGIMHFQ